MSIIPSDSTTRFGDRVNDYVRARPGYSPRVVELCVESGYLIAGDAVADVGSGSGLLTKKFLDRGYEVFGVEPNEAMRLAAETRLGAEAGFLSVDGTAEHTTLPAASVALVTAGQAFHWFDAERAKQEFCRILKPGGACLLVWNARVLDSSPFASSVQSRFR